MIGYISGQVVEYGAGYALVECGGIGYEMSVSSYTLTKLTDKPFVKMYTYLAVREDGVSLYGFISKEEKNMFLKLISISGIGPKGAQTILSGIELTELIGCIVTGDTKTLSKVKGIGKKTAERIVLELKENIGKELDDMPLSDVDNAPVALDKDEEDAVFALRGLGIGKNEAVKAVRANKEKANGLEDLIRLALRSI